MRVPSNPFWLGYTSYEAPHYAVFFQRTARRYIPDDTTVHDYRCLNLVLVVGIASGVPSEKWYNLYPKKNKHILWMLTTILFLLRVFYSSLCFNYYLFDSLEESFIDEIYPFSFYLNDNEYCRRSLWV
jgi:hypothetical protein